MDKRPNLDKRISLKDFEEFYWLKKELANFCREEGLLKTGGKMHISRRIAHFLKTGLKNYPQEQKARTAKSKFDWHSETIGNETIITDSYKNTANVRRFFLDEIGSHFKFNVKFMAWMKLNSGKTLQNAATEWRRINEEKKASNKPKEIAPQFEYNRYLRDFLADNPNASRSTGINLWKIKRSKRGDNIYQKSDLGLLIKK